MVIDIPQGGVFGELIAKKMVTVEQGTRLTMSWGEFRAYQKEGKDGDGSLKALFVLDGAISTGAGLQSAGIKGTQLIKIFPQWQHDCPPDGGKSNVPLILEREEFGDRKSGPTVVWFIRPNDRLEGAADMTREDIRAAANSFRSFLAARLPNTDIVPSQASGAVVGQKVDRLPAVMMEPTHQTEAIADAVEVDAVEVGQTNLSDLNLVDKSVEAPMETIPPEIGNLPFIQLMLKRRDPALALVTRLSDLGTENLLSLSPHLIERIFSLWCKNVSDPKEKQRGQIRPGLIKLVRFRVKNGGKDHVMMLPWGNEDKITVYELVATMSSFREFFRTPNLVGMAEDVDYEPMIDMANGR